MANEEKIRILDEQPAENAGSLLYIRTLAGSSDASKPTSLLANGSVYIETDTGKVFIFDEDNGWTEMQAGGSSGGGEKFIVTLTPTAEDFSGTMDKTPAEINAAYAAGKQIVFRIYVSQTMFYDINATLSINADGEDVPVFIGYGNLAEKFIVLASSTYSNTYNTEVYSLTPAS